MNDFKDNIFRFRSIQALLGDFKELEKQSIYFSSPEELNDPMEGMRQLVWKGDQISWKNLLRHYIFCLCQKLAEFMQIGEKPIMYTNEVAISSDAVDHLTPQMKYLYSTCVSVIENSEAYECLIKFLKNHDRKVRQSELEGYLQLAHLCWLPKANALFSEQGLISKNKLGLVEASDSLINLLRCYTEISGLRGQDVEENDWEEISKFQLKLVEQVSFRISLLEGSNPEMSRHHLIFEFPRDYVRSLSKLLYPNWYVSCFSKSFSNIAMWSYYANNHNGCCLVFRPELDAGNNYLPLLKRRNSDSDSSYSVIQDFQLREVEYTSNSFEIEFFSNIGFSSKYSVIDKCNNAAEDTSPAAHLKSEEISDWEERYWEGFYPALLNKFNDWRHEQEIRIIQSDIETSLDSKTSRVYHYELRNLAGVIFGMNVSSQDKMRIVDVMRSKETPDVTLEGFKFYQASLNVKSGEIEAIPLHFLLF